MRVLARFWPLWVGAFTGAACATLLSGLSPTMGGDRLRFTHARHKEAQVDCVACHEPVYDATDLTERHLPPEAKCMECHKAEKAKGNCQMCHTDVAAIGPRAPRDPHLNFDHAKHIERVEEDCTRCHVQLPELASPAAPPTMAACMSCHEHQVHYDDGQCGVCHKDLWDRPLKPTSVFAHDGGFLRGHSSAARSAGAACSQCHDQTFCSDCHGRTNAVTPEFKMMERVDRLFIHRADFIARHAIEANADPASCSRCHTTASCETCHAARNRDPGSANPRGLHPAGWAFPGAAEFHGDAARRDIQSCAVCHDRSGHSDCIDCHRVGGVGGNPHPPGFLVRHPKVDRNNGMCLECHL